MSALQQVGIVYLCLINLLGLLVCGIDKRKAIKHQYRISEKTLFLLALLFGSLGILLGMYGFRHKTKHIRFVIGIPFILIVQTVLLYAGVRI